MKVFMDYASATPIDRRVLRAMKPFLKKKFANPGALYKDGVESKIALEEARTQVARTLLCQEREIIWTGSGTESDNLALLGVFEAAKEKGVKEPHIITTAIEHPAVLEVCKEIERRGGRVSYVIPKENGIVSVEDIVRDITPSTVLVSVMYANNEIGTIQPIRSIARAIKKIRTERRSRYPYIHTDACQAVNYEAIDLPRLDVDMITLDGSKMYGPKGVGVLVRRFDVPLVPVIFGGGQEFGIRSGTENIAAIVGCAEALRIAVSEREKESVRLVVLRDELIRSMLEKIPGASVNGDIKERLPNNVNICLPGIDSEFFTISLDVEGVSASPGSACQNISEENSSHVITALGKPECARGSIRFTLGRGTKRRHIQQTVRIVEKIYTQMI